MREEESGVRAWRGVEKGRPPSEPGLRDLQLRERRGRRPAGACASWLGGGSRGGEGLGVRGLPRNGQGGGAQILAPVKAGIGGRLGGPGTPEHGECPLRAPGRPWACPALLRELPPQGSSGAGRGSEGQRSLKRGWLPGLPGSGRGAPRERVEGIPVRPGRHRGPADSHPCRDGPRKGLLVRGVYSWCTAGRRQGAQI